MLPMAMAYLISLIGTAYNLQRLRLESAGRDILMNALRLICLILHDEDAA